MAFALVGTIGAAVQSTSGGNASPTFGTGESRTAGNLLVLFSSVTGTATLPGTPSGWTIAKQVAGTSCSATIYYKVAAGSDTAPVITGVTSGLIGAQLAEYSGNSGTPVDQTGSTTGTTSPQTATFGGADKATSDLFLVAGGDFRSVARASNDTWTSNHATVVAAGNNNGVSSVNHYSFGYATSTSSISGADTAIMTLSITTSITGLAVVGASFKVPGVTTTSLSGSLSFVGSIIKKSIFGVSKFLASIGFGSFVDPRDISGLLSWYKADSISANDGDTLTGWNDSYGVRNLVNFNGSFKPTFKTNIINGKPVIRWDGTNSMCFQTAIGLPMNQPLTIIVIGKQTAKTSEGRFLDDSTDGFHFGFGNVTGIIAINNGSWGGDSTDHSGAFHILSAILNGASCSAYLDGSQVTLDNSNLGTNGIRTLMYVGGQGSGAGTTLNGDIAEILIYSGALSSNDRQTLESYASNRFNLLLGVSLTYAPAQLLKKALKSASAVLSFIGPLIKNACKSISATVSFIANFIYPWRQTGTLNFVGTLLKKSIKLLQSILSFIGSITKYILKALSAVLSFIGSSIKSASRLLSGSLIIGSGDYFMVYTNSSLLVLGGSAGSGETFQALSQSFTALTTYQANAISLRLYNQATPTDNITLSVYTGSPSGTFIATSNPIPGSSLTTNISWITFTFSSGFAINQGTKYYMVLTRDGARDTVNCYNWEVNTSDLFPNGGRNAKNNNAWAGEVSSQDLLFQILPSTSSLTKKTYRLLSAVLSFIELLIKRTGNPLSGTLSFVGSISKLSNKALTGISNFVGSCFKRGNRSLSATSNFVGSLIKQTNRSLTAALSFIGSCIKNELKVLASTIEFAGIITKKTFRTILGILSAIGSFTSSELNVLLLTATLSFSGVFSKRTGKLLTGLLSFTGSLSKLIRRTFTGILDFIGTLITQLIHSGNYSISFVASLDFIGTLNKVTAYLVAGTLSFIGEISKRAIISKAASLTLSGTLIKQAGRALVGVLSFIGSFSIIRVILMALAATLSFAGAITKRTGKSFPGALSWVGNIRKYISRSLVSTLNFIGATFKRIPVLLNGALSFIGTLSAGILAHTYYVLVEGTLLFAGGINRSIFRPIIGILYLSAEVSKFISRDLSGTLSFVVRFIRWASFNKIWSIEVPAPPVFTARATLSPVTITATVLKS